MEKVLKQLVSNQINEDEYFFLILSSIGVEETKISFKKMVESLQFSHPKIHHNLMILYVTNFSVVNTNNVPQPVNSDDDDLHMELALKLSVQTNDHTIGEHDSKSKVAEGNDRYCKRSHSPFTESRGVDPDESSTVTSSRQQHRKSTKLAPASQRTNTWSSLVKGHSTQAKLHRYSAFKYSPSTETNEVESGIKKSSKEANMTQPHAQGAILKSRPDVEKNSRVLNKKKLKGKNRVERPLLQKPVIMWFRRDLRIFDNPALIEACRIGGPVIHVFLWSEGEEGPLAAGGATKVWLHHALKCLNESIKEKYNSQIIIIRTKSCKQELTSLVQATGASTVIWNDLYEPWLYQRDNYISESLERKSVTVKRFHSYCIHNPYTVKTDAVGMRGIGSVSHFMACARMSAEKAVPLPEDPPPTMPVPQTWPNSHTLDDLELDKMPRRKDGSIIDWAAVIRKTWNFSENAAYSALEDFLSDRVRRYEKESARSDTPNTSGLSPYLHFGQISAQTVYHESKLCKSPKFVRKLAWRDLSYWLLTLFPKMATLPIRPHYRSQRWSQNKAHLKAWQKGKTGYPLVDAAMRELWLTGWMNNYMRHVVASFLIAYLHLHWIEGYNWFQDTLLDADVAINAMMWQNGGMSGLDHWNFVMHPVDAAMTCDPKGDYVRKWLPELAKLPDDHIHKPWKCPPSILKRCGVNLGDNYPERLVTDLEGAREQSLRDVVEARLKYGGGWVDEHGNDMVPLPSGRKIPVITRKEFKYKTDKPDSKDNPHSAVLKGYVSRQRDEAVAFANKVDFLCSTMDECVKRKEKYDRFSKMDAY